MFRLSIRVPHCLDASRRSHSRRKITLRDPPFRPPATPPAFPQRPPLPASPPLPTIPSTLTLPPGNFAIGDTVVVVGVGESGLNVRSAPGTDSDVKFRGREGELYVLKDGPQ